MLGEHPVFDVPPGYGLHHTSSLLFYAVLGVAGAIVSLIFTESLLKLRGWFQRLKAVPPWARPAIGSTLTGVLAVVALWWLKSGGLLTMSDIVSAQARAALAAGEADKTMVPEFSNLEESIK